MIKIDRISQKVSTKNYKGKLSNEQQEDFCFSKLDIDNQIAIITTNPGKSLNDQGLNVGASIPIVKSYNKLQLGSLNLKLLNNTLIEFCIDVEIPHKIYEFDNQKLFDAFRNAGRSLGILTPNKTDTRLYEDIVENSVRLKDIQVSQTMGTGAVYKFYDKSRQWEQKDNVMLEKQIYRFEIKFNSTLIRTNNFNTNIFISRAKAFLNEWSLQLGKTTSRYNKKEKDLIELFLKELY